MSSEISTFRLTFYHACFLKWTLWSVYLSIDGDQRIRIIPLKRTQKAAPPHDAVAPDIAESRLQVNRVVSQFPSSPNNPNQ